MKLAGISKILNFCMQNSVTRREVDPFPGPHTAQVSDLKGRWSAGLGESVEAGRRGGPAVARSARSAKHRIG